MSGTANQYITDNYLQNITEVTQNYDDIRHNYIKNYLTALKTISADPKYQYNERLDLNVLTNNAIDKTNIIKSPTLADGMQKDVNDMLIKENTLYIIGSITMATLLISAIVIGSE